MKRFSATITMLAGCVLWLSGCIGNSDYRIVSPTQGQTYVTLSDEADAPNQGSYSKFPAQLSISYSSKPGGSLNIYLNGNAIGSLFSYGATSATVNVAEIKDFLRQGSNTMTVEPLQFGPTATFILDSAGPQLTIKSVCYYGDDGCAVSSGEVQVDISAIDPTDVTQVTLEGNTASLNNGLYRVVVPVDSLYTFTAEDAFGFVSTMTYLGDGENIDEIFKVRIGESAISGLTPILDDAISGTQMDQQGVIDAGFGDWLYAGNFSLGKIWVRIKSINLGKATINNFSFDDSVSNRIHLDIDMVPAESTGYTAAAKNDGAMITTARDEVGTYAVVDVMTTYNLSYCEPDNDRFTSWFWCAPTTWASDMALLMETMDVSGGVDISLTNGEFDVNFMDDVTLAMGDTEAEKDADFIGSIVVLLKDTNLFQNMMASIVETVLKENLNQIRIGMSISNDAGYQFDLVTQAQNVWTDADNMYMQYSGMMDVTIPDPGVKPSLGSYYIDTPLPELLDDTSTSEDNLAVTVNMNMVNQVLNTLYSIGMTHLTITAADEQIHFGPDAVGDDMGADGDLKVELTPSGPGIMKLSGTQTNQGTLTYNEAQMTIYRKASGAWSPLFAVNVDISAGVLMWVDDQVFNMTINGSPDFRINSVKNYTILPISDELLSFAVDLMIMWGIPQVADTHLTIDIPDVDNPDYSFTTEVTTKDFSTEGGHLSFSMGINPQLR